MNMPPPIPGRNAAPHAPQPPRKRMSGCAIAAIAGAALCVFAIPVLAMLAAIALPAYQQYVARTKIQLAYQKSRALALDVDAFRLNHEGRCPAPDQMPLPDDGTVMLAQGRSASQMTMTLATDAEGRCAITLQFRGFGPPVEGRTLTLVSHATGQWDCTGGDLPAQVRPVGCRPADAAAR